MINSFYRNEAGILTFEWVLLLTILVIGVIAGLSSVRDSLNAELGDVSGAVLHVNQSYAAHQVETKVLKRPVSVNGERTGGGWFTQNFDTDANVNAQNFDDQMANHVQIESFD